MDKARVETAAGANDIESEPGGSTGNFENGDEEVKLYPNMPCTPDQFTGIWYTGRPFGVLLLL